MKCYRMSKVWNVHEGGSCEMRKKKECIKCQKELGFQCARSSRKV